MPDPNKAALDFLLTRRSRPAKTLAMPAPDRAALDVILTAAARSPDHGKLEPWRFVVLTGGALTRLASVARARGPGAGIDPEKAEKAATALETAPMIVAVIASPVASEKIPEVEQTLSAGAVCLALVNAALASGWGANWITGWTAYDRGFLEEALGLAPAEYVAGYIHLGSETATPPDRPRPDLAAKTEWRDA